MRSKCYYRGPSVFREQQSIQFVLCCDGRWRKADLATHAVNEYQINGVVGVKGRGVSGLITYNPEDKEYRFKAHVYGKNYELLREN